MLELFKFIKTYFPELVSYYFRQLGSFIMRVFTFICCFCGFGLGVLTYGLAFAIPLGLEYHFHTPPATTDLINKILLTIAPALPSFLYSTFSFESENTENSKEFSTDFCFIVWILTIIAAWFLL